VAYSRYVLDVGQAQDWLALQMALLPCLHADSVKEGNPYWKWIENYVADDYVEAVQKGSGTAETRDDSGFPTRIKLTYGSID
jgi:thiaminase